MRSRSKVVGLVGAWALLVLVGGAAMAAPGRPSFATEILPLFTKAGCNSGACHGAATGQGGFKLSLFGYDPDADHARLTRELGGRRVDFEVPDESLLLRKATGRVDHDGGKRWLGGSDDYAAVRAWIGEGGPLGDRGLRVTGLMVEPAGQLVRVTNSITPLVVKATLSDGRVLDVTRTALFSSNDDSVIDVDGAGRVRAVGPGASAVMVRYGGAVGVARVAVPFAAGETAGATGNPPEADGGRSGLIDPHVIRQLALLGLPVSGRSSDLEFLRRIHLDLTGRLPGVEVVRGAVGLGAAGRLDRQRVVEELLGSEGFTALWTRHLSELWLVGNKRSSEGGTRAATAWLRGKVAENRSYREIVREILVSEGSLEVDGPVQFFALAADPRDLAEHAARITLGIRLGCARCHAHPSDRWTREDHLGFSAYFSRIGRVKEAIRVLPQGELQHPESGVVVMPKPLWGSGAVEGADRRAMLLSWLEGEGERWFAKAFVNRVWKRLMGRGLVEPVDDLRLTNPPTHPEVLEGLVTDFVSHGHDLRRLVRQIVTSEAYQRSSVAVVGNGGDDRFYSRALVKRPVAEVFLDMISQATGVWESFPGEKAGVRAVELPGARVESAALDLLGRCSREVSCETTVLGGGGLARALHLINGETLNRRLSGGVLQELMGQPAEQILEALYLRTVSRLPRPEERRVWLEICGAGGSGSEAWEDLFWALLNSHEFSMIH